jgi:hypothetical protein
MAIIEKAATLVKSLFVSSDGSAVAVPYGSGQQSDAGPLQDLTGYLSAMPPLPATGPSNYEMRSRDFRIAENLDYIPGNGKFPALRAVVDKWNVLRVITDTKKDLVATVGWTIKAEPQPGESEEEATKRAADDPVIKELTKFFECPDGENVWFSWLKLLLENVYVLDALPIQMVRDRKGKIAKLVIVDGSTINRVVDDRGWTPQSVVTDKTTKKPLKDEYGNPQLEMAYQQVVGGSGSGSEGTPQRNYTVRDLLYVMRNPRPGFKYGQSSVEKIIQYALTGIYADQFIKEYYTSGNQPEGIMVLSGMPPEKVEEYEKKWNAVYTGNLATRRRVAIVSAGTGDQKNVQYIPTKEPLLKSDAYMDFIRFACAEFSIPSVPFERPMNRASAQESGEQAEAAGVVPDLKFLEGILNKIIKDPLYFNQPGYSFAFAERRDVDALKQSEVDKNYVGSAIMTINETRKRLGLSPAKETEADTLGYGTPNMGFMPLDQEAATEKLQSTQQPTPEKDEDAAPGGKTKPAKKPPAGKKSSGVAA